MEKDGKTSDDTAYHTGCLILPWSGGRTMSDDDVRQKAKELAETIRRSDTYMEYKVQKERISAQPELYEQVNRYRELNYELQNSPQTDDLFDRVEAFEKEYARFRQDPIVDAFLRAELALCRLMQETQNIISGEIDFDLHRGQDDCGMQ